MTNANDFTNNAALAEESIDTKKPEQIDIHVDNAVFGEPSESDKPKLKNRARSQARPKTTKGNRK